MIPKIIHYCWFGPNPLPKRTKMCLASWKRYCPDYELKLWNEQNSPINNSFCQEALRYKKWAFVADYVRVWALFNYGGIYMDTDMIVIRPLDSLLQYDCFTAYEKPNKSYLSFGLVGAIQGHPYMQGIKKYYDSIEFDRNKIENITIPLIATTVYNKLHDKDIVKIFNYDWFYPFPGEKRRTGQWKKYITKNTYAVHLWDFSWLTLSERIKILLKKLFSLKK